MSQNWFEIAGTQTVLKILIGLIFFLPTYGILLNYILKKIKYKWLFKLSIKFINIKKTISMNISAELTLLPLKNDFIPEIKKFIKSLRNSELKITENPLSTHVYGDYDKIMNLLDIELKKVFSENESIMIFLKLVKGDKSDYRPNF